MSGKSILSAIGGFDHFVHETGQQLGAIAPSLKGHTHLNILPLVMLAFALVAIFGLVFAARPKLADTESAVIPDGSLTVRTFWELFLDAVLGMMEDIMGPSKARRFFPLIATSAVIIFFSNLLGLVPGFLPPTDSFNLNMAMAAVIFVATHYAGLSTNGFGHIKHMMNPSGLWWGWLLAPLMFSIEIISHLVRPLSLSLRLMLNMIGDHAVLSQFLTLIDYPILYPLPIMALGLIVCVVQTAVFSLLSMVYIGLAVEDLDHH